MKVSAKTEYACVAMLDLAARYGSERPVQIRQIAQRHGVPPRFLVQILLQLKGAGLVASVRGAGGGYRLVAPPESISLGQVMAAVSASDEAAAPAGALPDSPAVKVLAEAWHEVHTAQRRMLEAISLADLLKRAKGRGEAMYHI